MKSVSTIFLSVLFFLAATICSAGTIGTTGTITRIGTGWTGDGLYISLNQSFSTSCPNSSMIFIAITAPQYKETTSIILAAHAQAKPITIYYDNSACPRGDIPTIIGVAVN